MSNTWTRRQAIAGPTCPPSPWSGATCAHPAGRPDPCAAHRYKTAAPPCPELHSTAATTSTHISTTTGLQPAASLALLASSGDDDMQRGDCCQFMAVPPPRQQYQYDDEAAAQQRLMHQLMLAAAAGAGDQHQQDDAAGRGSPGIGGGGGGERKRRFTEEQVRSLETTFHARRARLEPREKAELARELGLQPRQVAIWFQNKRARWRSKQLEHDYAALRAQYDALHARVESLRHEKLALAKQVDELRGRLRERQDQSGSCEVNDDAEAAEDDKRNSTTSSHVQDDSATPPSAVDASVDSAATEYYGHMAEYEVLHDPFCAVPDLWDTWPLLEWNAVA